RGAGILPAPPPRGSRDARAHRFGARAARGLTGPAVPPPAEDARRPRRFRDRRAAGIVLGERLQEYRGRSDVIVLGLPRGGVPVAAEVARALEAPLEVFLVRKLGVPGQEE